MKKKILIAGAVALGIGAVWWLMTPKPQNWSKLPFLGKLQWLVLRTKASTIDGSVYE